MFHFSKAFLISTSAPLKLVPLSLKTSTGELLWEEVPLLADMDEHSIDDTSNTSQQHEEQLSVFIGSKIFV